MAPALRLRMSIPFDLSRLHKPSGPTMQNTSYESLQKDYEQAWREYRRLRIRAVLLMVAAVLWGLVLPFLCNTLPRLARSSIFALFNFAVALTFVVYWGRAFWWLATFKCPRCGKNFARSTHQNWPGNRCKHCKIRVGSGPPSEEGGTRNAKPPL